MVFFQQDAVTCSCKTGCAGRCKCFKSGVRCASGCQCSSCSNAFNQLQSFFGQADVTANPCFTSWLKGKAKSIDIVDSEFVELLRSSLFGVKEGDTTTAPTGDCFGYDKDLADLAEKWKKPDTTAEEKEGVVKAIIRIGLGVEKSEDRGYFFSFCSWSWHDKICTTHCGICGECRGWRDWHCKVCNKCSYGLSSPCECGGVSDMYYSRHAMERQMAYGSS
ncbi:hypothetical protein EJ08DRAFT_605272 [Tothia fuscella]|uniref:Tesmin/TSO1-like CXC domain-containing protein n=1 Tax=Tothia fuscella TaxID=1048955 RepID=A0A9P4U392_9PEZI|nr:hypothetical protein EJ08DRAFT_605272 [Tothia fuscella]